MMSLSPAAQTDGYRRAWRTLSEIAAAGDQGCHAARAPGNQHHLSFQAILFEQLQVLRRPQRPLKARVTVIADHHAFLRVKRLCRNLLIFGHKERHRYFTRETAYSVQR